MEARVKIQKWGSNLGISIPQIFATELSLREGIYMNIHDKNNTIIIEPVKQNNSYNLTEMLNQITESNIHQTVDTGIPTGNEIW